MFSKATVGAVIVSILLVSFAASPVAAQSTVGEIQSSIQSLLARIAELTQQLNVLRTQQTVISTPAPEWNPSVRHRICAILYRSLSQGQQGDDVKGLQEFLLHQGHLAVAPTGFFGPMTVAAVAKWQAAEGLEQAGIFGPKSRERIRIWCGGGGPIVENRQFSASPTSGQGPLTVTFYSNVGGFRPASISYVIDFGDGTTERASECYAPADGCQRPGQNTHTYTQNGNYTATLSRITDNCPVGAQCFVGPRTEIIGKVQIYVGAVACTKEYAPVCGSKPIVCITTPCNPIQQTYGNRCTMAADGASFLYAGECRSTYPNPADDPQCKRWGDGKWCGQKCSRDVVGGSYNCAIPMCMPTNPIPPDEPPRCLEYFNDTNRPPTVSGVSGPTTLNVNQAGTWTIQASDPENQPLKYRVTWGDEALRVAPYQSSVTQETFTQTTTFSHAYSSAGTYTVIFVVIDSAGNEAKTSITVKVGETPVACTLEYNPVCGQPPEPACRHSIPACMMATPGPQTYSNRCFMNAAGASFLYQGQCQTGYACTADAYQCPSGQWVGRTGSNCQFVCPSTY